MAKGLTAFEIHLQYQANKANCGRRKIELPDSEVQYINQKVQEDWTPDVIIGCGRGLFPASMRTLYRKFKSGEFNQKDLPMQGKRKPNGHQEKRGKQNFRRTIRDRDSEYPNYQQEFGHLGRRYHCWTPTQERCYHAG